MSSVLGLPLTAAKERLEQEGLSVECREVTCRKGNPGSDARVIAQREEAGRVVLLYSGFQTTIKQ